LYPPAAAMPTLEANAGEKPDAAPATGGRFAPAVVACL